MQILMFFIIVLCFNVNFLNAQSCFLNIKFAGNFDKTKTTFYIDGNKIFEDKINKKQYKNDPKINMLLIKESDSTYIVSYIWDKIHFYKTDVDDFTGKKEKHLDIPNNFDNLEKLAPPATKTYFIKLKKDASEHNKHILLEVEISGKIYKSLIDTTKGNYIQITRSFQKRKNISFEQNYNSIK